jgi:hypothetical protein
MFDHRVIAAQRQIDEDAEFDNFITDLQESIYNEIKPYLWSNSTEPHDLKAAESIIEERTGTAYEISELLFNAIENPSYNDQQIWGFIEDLMYGTMNSDSGLELASIISEIVTEDSASIIEHHKQDSYDGPDSDEGY